MEIENATLSIFFKNGEDLNLDLSPFQLIFIKEFLGLEIDLQTGLANMYGEQTLKRIYEKEKGFLEELKNKKDNLSN